MRWDSLGAGVMMGLLAPLLGFFGYAAIYVGAIRPHLDLDFFIHDLFLGTREYQAPVLTLSLFANLALFFTLDRWSLYKAMRGVIAATFVYAVVIVLLLYVF
ncbi:MAG: hypothetical protein IPO05_08840 [Flavobacteriales bacterium]|jgi:hypothetical protein|nr:hypothetical protein [Flavobacteriales bacterium]